MLDNLMKQLEETQQRMKEALDQEIIKVDSQNKEVSVTVNGNREIKEVTINPAFLIEENVEMIEDLLITVLNDAMQQAQVKEAEASKSNLGNMMPGGFDMGSIFGS